MRLRSASGSSVSAADVHTPARLRPSVGKAATSLISKHDPFKGGIAAPSHNILMKTHRILFTIVALTCAAPSAFADHGPGTSGGGTSTQSAETPKRGQFSVETGFELTEFDHPSQRQIERSAERAGHYDLLDRSSLSSASVFYGITENFQLGLSIGYYDAEDAREAEAGEHHHESKAAEHEAAEGDEHHAAEEAPAGFETHRFNPDGLTDLLLAAKYRFYRGPLGQFALIGGVKMPTGRREVRNSAGEAIEPAATAGSGSWDVVAGLAYSTYLTAQLTLDTSVQYTLRTEHDDLKIGDRFDAGLAMAYRFTREIEQYPQVSIFAEANVRHLRRSEEAGEGDENTGGTALFLSPGARIRFSKHAAFAVAPQFPAVQDLNGEQLETSFKITAAFTLSF